MNQSAHLECFLSEPSWIKVLTKLYSIFARACTMRMLIVSAPCVHANQNHRGFRHQRQRQRMRVRLLLGAWKAKSLCPATRTLRLLLFLATTRGESG